MDMPAICPEFPDDHMKEYPADVFDMERLMTSIYQHGDMQNPR